MNGIIASGAGHREERSWYQLTIYHYATAEQEKTIDDYLEKAYLPVLTRNGIKSIGVFKAKANDTSAVKSLYVFIPVSSPTQLSSMAAKIASDKNYQLAAAAYNNALYTAAPYTRLETIFLQAFPLAPLQQQPALKAEKKDRIYELRSYESATETIFRNKIKMFNEGGEITLFKRLNFNAIFYGEVVAGAHMPNLMYMTSFENMADRDTHWKTFSDDPEWKKLSALPEYQHNVAHIDITFLVPASYSGF